MLLFWAEVKNKKAISIHLPNCRRMDIVVFRDLAVSLLNCLSQCKNGHVVRFPNVVLMNKKAEIQDKFDSASLLLYRRSDIE